MPHRTHSPDINAMFDVAPHLTVDLTALRANYRTLASVSGAPATGAAVKANAYGLGVEPVAKALAAEGCQDFFVATVGEGQHLRKLIGPDAAIFVLNGVFAPQIPAAVAARLTPVINSPEQWSDWMAARTAHPEATAGLHLDTGMNRLGLSAKETEDVLGSPEQIQNANLALIMSHLACAPEPDHPLNARQLDAFTHRAHAIKTHASSARLSLANSGGVYLGHAYGFDLTRPGIALYGGDPHDGGEVRMRTVVTVSAPILQIRTLDTGESVGYGADYVASRPVRSATVALGYADGFLRSASGAGYGVVDERRAPILGRVSMDLIALDITHIANVRPGDQVEFLGPQARLDEQAALAGTAAYEFLTRLGPRCVRTYQGDDA